MVGSKDPVVERSLGPAPAGNPSDRRCARVGTGLWRACPERSRRVQRSEAPHLHSRSSLQQWGRRSIQHFFWPQLFKFFLNAASGRFARELRRAKLAGRKIERRKTHAIPDRRHRRQKVVLLRVQRRIRCRARRDHARHLAPHQLLRQARVFHLFADRDLEPAPDQFCDVALGGVVGHATHGDGHAFFFIARGQRDLQLARGQHRVVEEKLVEIPQPEEQQSVGMLFLDGGILPHQRRRGLGHRGIGNFVISNLVICNFVSPHYSSLPEGFQITKLQNCQITKFSI